MAKCKCKSSRRIVSNVVASMSQGTCCRDVCVNPTCGEPHKLSVFTPLIYDEIGVNLCTTFDMGVDVAATYPTACKARINVVNILYSYGDTGVTITTIPKRPNCCSIHMTNLHVQFKIDLFDSCDVLVGTIFPTAVYLPLTEEGETYNEDTNPTSVELEIFAPYGPSVSDAETKDNVLQYIGFSISNNYMTQGLNMYSIGKLLELDIPENTVTVGLTLVVHSLYYSGYTVENAGKIDVPKGTIVTPEESDCIKFVEGDLLNLAIKPLDLGYPYYEEELKQECEDTTGILDDCID